MKKLTGLFLAIMLLVMPVVGTGCTEADLSAAVLSPVIQSLVGSTTGVVVDLFECQLSGGLDDSPLCNAVVAGLGAGFEALVDSAVDTLLPE